MTVRLAMLLGALLAALGAGACGEGSDRAASEAHRAVVSGSIRIDGARVLLYVCDRAAENAPRVRSIPTRCVSTTALSPSATALIIG